jgi:hypothetical protein
MNVLPLLIIIGAVRWAVEASVKCEIQDPNLEEMDFQGWIRVAIMSNSEKQPESGEHTSTLGSSGK